MPATAGRKVLGLIKKQWGGTNDAVFVHHHPDGQSREGIILGYTVLTEGSRHPQIRFRIYTSP